MTCNRLAAPCLALLLVVTAGPWVSAETPEPRPKRLLLATEGRGYLEIVDGYRVLHLAGTPEEMGCQHGRLLKEAVAANCTHLLAGDGKGLDPLWRGLAGGILNAVFRGQVPDRFLREMKGLADGAGLSFDSVLACNLIPELFHCSGFALLSKATATGDLYHGRVLDYGVDLRLQDHAVLIIQEPEGRQPFVNVSYAGFIGSVTGMNTAGISIGEMGGGGVGQWRGVPMSLLVRTVLEDARSLRQAVAVFKDNPRTCEYYYVIADAQADTAVGLWATPEKLVRIGPGERHERLPDPVEHAVVLSAGDRYHRLVERVRDGFGTFTEEKAVRLMDGPVAMKSNLHDALMVPGRGVLYVANAAQDGAPAWKQTYHRFDIRRLMKERPERRAPAVRSDGIGPAERIRLAAKAVLR